MRGVRAKMEEWRCISKYNQRDLVLRRMKGIEEDHCVAEGIWLCSFQIKEWEVKINPNKQELRSISS